jgi:sulfur-carrier protein
MPLKRYSGVHIMSLKVVIPTPLRKFTSGAEVVEIEAKTVKEALDILDAKFPGFRASVCDESGSLRRFINVYLDGEDVRFLENLATPVNDGSEIAIVPAISGGSVHL